jgi:hypothetical protein
VAVALVLDTSGSMLAKFGQKRRIDVAKSVLHDLVTDVLPAGTPVSLRVFRQVPKSCQTELAMPLGPLDPATLGPLIDAISVDKRIGTPLAAAIEAAGQDLAAVQGPRIAVVVSDGQESCGGDPEAAVRSLVSEGVDIRLNIVGLGLDRRSRKRIGTLAELGNGAYFDVRDPAGLAEALAGAVSPPVRVLAVDGSLVATGTLGGKPVAVPPGVYRVEVLTEPPRTFDSVLVSPGQTARLSLAEGEGS